MTRDEAKMLNNAFENMVNEFCIKNKISPIRFNLAYNESDLTWTVKAKLLDETGAPKVNDVEEYRAKIRLQRSGINYKGPIIGRYFDIEGLGCCRIEGFNTRANSYPFLVRRSNGKLYKVTPKSIKWC